MSYSIFMMSIGVFMMSIGVFIMIGVNRLFKPTDFSTWTEAEGVVEEVCTRGWTNGRMRTTAPRIIVEFEMNGNLVKGRSNYIGKRKNIKQVIAKYPKGMKVHFRYNDKNKSLLSSMAKEMKCFKYIYIQDVEFSDASGEKIAEIISYGFGMIFVLLGIIGIVSI